MARASKEVVKSGGHLLISPEYGVVGESPVDESRGGGEGAAGTRGFWNWII